MTNVRDDNHSSDDKVEDAVLIRVEFLKFHKENQQFHEENQ